MSTGSDEHDWTRSSLSRRNFVKGGSVLLGSLAAASAEASPAAGAVKTRPHP